jgi:hypothetical protein
MLVIYVNSRINRRSGGKGKDVPPTTVCRQFPVLLSAPVVEPRVLSRNTVKWRLQKRHLYCNLAGPSFAVLYASLDLRNLST